MVWNRFGKFNARKVKIDNYLFDSIAESKRYLELCLLSKANEITNLEVHPIFDLRVKDVLVCRYEADFGYFDKSLSRTIYEDVKGMQTHDFKIKHKLFKALYPELELRLIRA